MSQNPYIPLPMKFLTAPRPWRDLACREYAREVYHIPLRLCDQVIKPEFHRLVNIQNLRDRLEPR